MKKTNYFTAVYKKVKQGYVGWVEELPGVNTQGKTISELKENLSDAMALVIETNRLIAKREARGSGVIREPLAISV